MRWLGLMLCLCTLTACRSATEPRYAMIEECLDCAGRCACRTQCHRNGSPVPDGECHERGVVAPVLDGPMLDGPMLNGPVLDGPVLNGPVLDGPVPEERLGGDPLTDDERLLEELLRCEADPDRCPRR